jgi:hypothetical protein
MNLSSGLRRNWRLSQCFSGLESNVFVLGKLMKKICSIIAIAICGVVSAQADDTLYVNYLNNGETVTADVTDPFLNVNVDAYVGSLNEGLWDGSSYTALPLMFCDDLVDEINVPTSYSVSVSSVDNSAAWLIEHFGSLSNTNAQDAGLQMAVWEVTFPGTTFSSINVSGNPGGSPFAWMNYYLTADNYIDSNGNLTGNSYTAVGIQYTPTTSYGQGMIGAPGPIAALPFLLGFARRRKRN